MTGWFEISSRTQYWHGAGTLCPSTRGFPLAQPMWWEPQGRADATKGTASPVLLVLLRCGGFPVLGYVLLDQDCSVPCCGSRYFYFGFLSGYEPFGVPLLSGAVRNSSLKMLVGFYSLLMARWLSGEVLWDFFFFWKGNPSRWTPSF